MYFKHFKIFEFDSSAAFQSLHFSIVDCTLVTLRALFLRFFHTEHIYEHKLQRGNGSTSLRLHFSNFILPRLINLCRFKWCTRLHLSFLGLSVILRGPSTQLSGTTSTIFRPSRLPIIQLLLSGTLFESVTPRQSSRVASPRFKPVILRGISAFTLKSTETSLHQNKNSHHVGVDILKSAISSVQLHPLSAIQVPCCSIVTPSANFKPAQVICPDLPPCFHQLLSQSSITYTSPTFQLSYSVSDFIFTVKVSCLKA